MAEKSITLKLEEIQRMKKYYEQYLQDPVEHSVFFAKVNGVTITAFQSGTVRFQGASQDNVDKLVEKWKEKHEQSQNARKSSKKFIYLFIYLIVALIIFFVYMIAINYLWGALNKKGIPSNFTIFMIIILGFIISISSSVTLYLYFREKK